jgi:hypothetical protein
MTNPDKRDHKALQVQAAANLAQLRTHSINTVNKAELSPVELIAARRLAQVEFQAALRAKKLNFKGFKK